MQSRYTVNLHLFFFHAYQPSKNWRFTKVSFEFSPWIFPVKVLWFFMTGNTEIVENILMTFLERKTFGWCFKRWRGKKKKRWRGRGGMKPLHLSVFLKLHGMRQAVHLKLLQLSWKWCFLSIVTEATNNYMNVEKKMTRGKSLPHSHCL